MNFTDKEYDLIVFCIRKHLIYFDNEDGKIASNILSTIRESREEKVISSQELEGDISTIKDDDYAECVDTLLDNMKTT